MKIIEKEMQEEGKEYVYIAEFVGGFCKIGVSNNPVKRLREISRRNQISLKDYFLVEGYFKLEKYLHNHFKEKRRYSEWFEVDFLKLKEYIIDLDFEYIAKLKEKNTNLKLKANSIAYYECKKTVDVIINGDKDILKSSEMFINLINSYVYKNEIKNKFIDFEKDKVDYLNLNKELGEEEFLNAIEDLKDYKSYEDLILNLTEYSFLNNEIFRAYLQNEINYFEILILIKEKINLILKEKNKELVKISFEGLQELESKIATFIEFTDTGNMTDKEVYALVKNHIEK